jgi:hypothetical protein
VYANLRFSFRVDPSICYMTAWKQKTMWTVAIDNGEFQITVNWCFRYFFPHLTFYGAGITRALIYVIRIAGLQSHESYETNVG